MKILIKLLIWAALLIFTPWPVNIIVLGFGCLWFCYQIIKWGW